MINISAWSVCEHMGRRRLVTKEKWWRTNHTNLLKHWLVGLWSFVHMRGYFQANPPFDQSSFCCCFCGWISYGRLGLSVETFLIVQKSLLGGMDFYRRRLFRRTRICEFPCARREHRQQRLHSWWWTSYTQTSGAAWFSSLGTCWAPG